MEYYNLKASIDSSEICNVFFGATNSKIVNGDIFSCVYITYNSIIRLDFVLKLTTQLVKPEMQRRKKKSICESCNPNMHSQK